MNQIDLSGLRDIHLPTEPSIWPLATGWYVLLCLILFLIIICCIVWHWHKNRPLPYALHELEKIKNTPENQLKLLSQLLKRVAMAKYGRKEIAPLTEDSWQEFLLSAAPNTLTTKQAYLLAFVLYMQGNQTIDPPLYKNTQQWIKVVLKNRK